MAKKTMNALCRAGLHDWAVAAGDGWFFCHRSGCSVYATCPACLGVRVADTHVRFCSEHLRFERFLADYPLAAPVPVEVASSVEQQALW